MFKKIKQISAMVAIATIAFSGFSFAAKKQPAISGQVICEGKPVVGVQVSDGTTVVVTDEKGNYVIPKSDKYDGTVYITTPSGYVALSNDGFQPGFWRTLNPDVNIAEIHNFELKKEDQSKYSVLFVPDLHIKNETECRDLEAYETLALPKFKELFKKYSEQGPVYAFNLGDISHDLFWYEYGFPLPKVIEYLKEKGWPMQTYSVSGNHDNDPAIIGEDVDRRAAWLYRKTLGPAQYSVNIGNEHWVFMDNIFYINNSGEGKKAPGVKGDRSYVSKFTPRQLEWLKKDLSYVAPNVNVKLVCHSPLLMNTRKAGLIFKPEDMKAADDAFSSFENVEIYSGHAHSLNYCLHEDYPRFVQYYGPAASGNMWTTSRYYQTMSTDGTQAGVFVNTYSKDGVNEREFYTYTNGQAPMRVYDLNEVGAYYRNDSIVRKELELYPKRPDYGDEKFKNCILINYWLYRPDYVIEVIENDQLLPVRKVTDLEDPLWNISYIAPNSVKLGKYKAGFEASKAAHQYLVKAMTADSPVEIRVKDRNGKLVHAEILHRPKAFNHGMK